MVVVEGVICHLARLSVLYKSQVFQKPKLMRNGRFGHSKQSRDVTDAQFFLVKGENNIEAGRIAKHFENFAEIKDGSFIAKCGSCRPNTVFMDEGNLTFFFRFFMAIIML